MASIDITTQSGAVGNGDLQLQNGAPMDATLRFVTDAVNTASPLKLSTSLVQTTSTLKITTNDNPYIDAEDGSGNNRFTVGRAPASQQVNVDFASNPAGSTTAVGAIRTFRDGTNLSEAMTFIEDGSVGIGTTAPVGLLDLYKAAAATRLAIRGDAGQNRLISYRTGAVQRFGLYVNNTAESGSNAGSDFAIRAYNDAGTLLSTPLFIERSSGNIGINTTTPTQKLQVTSGSILTQGISGGGAFNLLQPITASSDARTWAIGASVASFGDFGIKQSNAKDGDPITAGDTKFYISNTGNVGIGTTTPESKLHVADGVSGGIVSVFVDNNINALNSTSQIKFAVDAGGSLTNGGAAIQAVNVNANFANTDLVFRTSYVDYGSLAEIFRLTDANKYLRMASGTGGIQFNGDTAAANALDDYEEGTWTPVFTASTSGTVNMLNSAGTYTKIGNLVTCQGYGNVSSVSLPTGEIRVTGLPFVSSQDCGSSVFVYSFGNTSIVTAYQSFVGTSLNYGIVRGLLNGAQINTVADNLQANSGMIFTFSYRV